MKLILSMVTACIFFFLANESSKQLKNDSARIQAVLATTAALTDPLFIVDLGKELTLKDWLLNKKIAHDYIDENPTVLGYVILVESDLHLKRNIFESQFLQSPDIVTENQIGSNLRALQMIHRRMVLGDLPIWFSSTQLEQLRSLKPSEEALGHERALYEGIYKMMKKDSNLLVAVSAFDFFRTAKELIHEI